MDYDIIDIIIGEKLKGIPRKVAYVLVWLLMMAALVVVLITTVIFALGLLESFVP